ncbi:hypothetical protein BDZ94DRAFT_1238760 [Collybia nuda]|uniref:Uncharacterized protein n=1 Tax=Collybia nuda TaxID=64659 RepID=A0A9P6CBY6_9AGAR|nr:hypothetical protein BDZ94DRAFT_1238760 [Collybia nuda]
MCFQKISGLYCGVIKSLDHIPGFWVPGHVFISQTGTSLNKYGKDEFVTTLFSACARPITLKEPNNAPASVIGPEGQEPCYGTRGVAIPGGSLGISHTKSPSNKMPLGTSDVPRAHDKLSPVTSVACISRASSNARGRSCTIHLQIRGPDAQYLAACVQTYSIGGPPLRPPGVRNVVTASFQRLT